MTPDEYCQQKAAASGSSFYYSFLFLPPERRRAITALYAFCREVDDAADEVSDVDIARTKLAWWRTEIANLFAGHPAHPVTLAAIKALAGKVVSVSARIGELEEGLSASVVSCYPSSASLFCTSSDALAGFACPFDFFMT